MSKKLPSWSWSIRLPKSTFPPRAAPHLQSSILQRCTTDLYAYQSQARKDQVPFILHDGPPYANGSLHVGHALNKILKDIINRTQIQNGRRVHYVPGWDCHGLPIELKALGAANPKDMSPMQVRKEAKKLATKTVGKQMKEFQSYAIMADWDRRWTTMDRGFEVAQLKLFAEMARRGLITRRFKPGYWAPTIGTAIAEGELEYNDKHESTAAYVKFPIVGTSYHDGEEAVRQVLGINKVGGAIYALIWTTTPWTLPANRAIAIRDDIEYVASRIGEDVIITSEHLFGKFWPFEGAEKLAAFNGVKLRELKYQSPLRGSNSKAQPIIHADFVTNDSGSGLVHLAPAHGVDDYEVCKGLDLDLSAPVDDDGCFTADAYLDEPDLLTGAFALREGVDKILSILGDHVLDTHKYVHKYPYDTRSKNPVMIRATAQWFADVKSIMPNALAAIKGVNFVPAGSRKRLEAFVNGRSEWCISRQRAWGVPIPVLFDQNGEAVMTDDSVEHIIGVFEQRGCDAWFSDQPYDPAWVHPTLPKDGKQYVRGKDTMDVWFDSGSSWTQQGDKPADIYIEGSDQHRGWFQSSLLIWVAAFARHSGKLTNMLSLPTAPYKTLVTHGFTLDQEGKKMSKSVGNVVSPEQVMDGSLLPPMKPRKGANTSDKPKYDGLGPDALRLWVASSDYTHDVALGESILQPVHAALLKYRTTIKMLLGSVHEQADTLPLTLTDQIALLQLADTVKEVRAAYDSFEFHKAISAINRWVNNEFSAFYLEAAKDRLYCGDGGGALRPILLTFLQMLAPITPMMAVEATQHLPTWLKVEDMEIFSAPLTTSPWQWLGDDVQSRLPHNESFVRKAIPALSTIHETIKVASERARNVKLMGSSLQGSVILQIADPATLGMLDAIGTEELEKMFVVSSLAINEPPPSDAAWKFSELTTLSASPDVSTRAVVVWLLPPNASKCPRCWRYQAPAEDKLCGRCEDIVKTLDQPEALNKL